MRWALLGIVLLMGWGGKKDVQWVKIGTGAQVGVYYTAGLALAVLPFLFVFDTDKRFVNLAISPF